MGNDRLAIVIPARREIYLQRTIDNLLAQARGEIEIIVVLDGYDAPMVQEARVKVIRNPVAIGQRAAVNLGANSTDARYFMKCDGHCTFDEGFDVKLKVDCEYDWTIIPRMYNLDCAIQKFLCPQCGGFVGTDEYQPEDFVFACGQCRIELKRQDLKTAPWENFFTPKWRKKTDFNFITAPFSGTDPGKRLRFGYWQPQYRENRAWGYHGRAWTKPEIADTMGNVGACWFSHRQRFLDLGGLDETHGSWGQCGVEITCKAWLSGGRLAVNKKTWFAHWFRGHMGGAPYRIDSDRLAYRRSWELWVNDTWSPREKSLLWLAQRFWPVPGWKQEDLDQLQRIQSKTLVAVPAILKTNPQPANDRLAIAIPARNEKYLQRTVDDILSQARGEIEVYPIIDGWDEAFCRKNNLPWPMKLTQENTGDSRVKVIRPDKPVGQRGGTNLVARSTAAGYFMKADAHCAFDAGFDVKLKEKCGYQDTVMPWFFVMDCEENLWLCPKCRERTVETPDQKRRCPLCLMEIPSAECSATPNPDFWTPKRNRGLDYLYISNAPGLVHRSQYWSEYARRPEARQAVREGGLVETMSGQGACWLNQRERFLELGGLDEAHGSWGQVGTEMACKSWLSGGRYLIHKGTWFAHWWRGHGGWPYHITETQMTAARDYSREFWRNGQWPLQRRPLSWLVRKFWPVPSWAETAVRELDATCRRKVIVYYTDNSLPPDLEKRVQFQLRQSAGFIPIVCVSQKPLDFGDIKIWVGDIGRSHLSMYRQLLAGVEAAPGDTIYLAEHDVLYHPDHFGITLHTDDKFCYNTNIIYGHLAGKSIHTYTKTAQPRYTLSQLFAGRDILLSAFRERVRILELGLEIPRGIPGMCEPGVNEAVYQARLREQSKAQNRPDLGPLTLWQSDGFILPYPNVDLRHGGNLTGGRRGEINLGVNIDYWGELKAMVAG